VIEKIQLILIGYNLSKTVKVLAHGLLYLETKRRESQETST
jgi:hypothetical protein